MIWNAWSVAAGLWYLKSDIFALFPLLEHKNMQRDNVFVTQYSHKNVDTRKMKLASLCVCVCGVCLSSSVHAWMSTNKSPYDCTSVCKCVKLNVCMRVRTPVCVFSALCKQTDRTLKQGEKCAAWKYQSCSDMSLNFLPCTNRLAQSAAACWTVWR